MGKPDDVTSFVTAREVYQMLRDVALEIRTLRRVSSRCQLKTQDDVIAVEVDGWLISLGVDCRRLDRCETCRTPDGRTGSPDNWQVSRTDPVSLMSKWEHEQFEKILFET